MVTTLNHTYTFPEIASKEFRRQQEQAQTHQWWIQEYVRPQPRLFGFMPYTSVKLIEEEPFRELDLLVCDYDAIIQRILRGLRLRIKIRCCIFRFEKQQKRPVSKRLRQVSDAAKPDGHTAPAAPVAT